LALNFHTSKDTQYSQGFHFVPLRIVFIAITANGWPLNAAKAEHSKSPVNAGFVAI